MTINVLEELMEVMTNKDKSDVRVRRPGNYHPSEAMRCARLVYYNILDPAGAKDDMPLGLFAMGKAAEEGIITPLKEKYGDRLDEQVRMDWNYENINISGYADFVLKDENGKVIHVFEIKSARDLSRCTGIKTHHKAQLVSYLSFFKCQNGSLLYVDRSDIWRLKQFDYLLDFDFAEKVFEHFRYIDRCIKAQTIPPAVPVEKWECGYCGHKKKCAAERVLHKAEYRQIPRDPGWEYTPKDGSELPPGSKN